MRIKSFHYLSYVLTLAKGKRMVKNIMSSRKDQVDKFKSKFDELRNAFQANSVAEIETTVLRMVDDLQSVKRNLDGMGM